MASPQIIKCIDGTRVYFHFLFCAEKKNSLASIEKGSNKNKLMQAFQELDKQTPIQTSADCWESPPTHTHTHTPHFKHRDRPDNAPYWVNITLLRAYLPSSNHLNTAPSSSRRDCASRIFTELSESFWMEKSGCLGDTEDVAFTTVQ